MVPPPLCSPYHLQNQTNSLRAWLQTKRATLFLNLSNFGTAIQHLWGHWSLYIGMHEYVQRRLDNSEVDAHRNTSTKYRWTDMNWTDCFQHSRHCFTSILSELPKLRFSLVCRNTWNTQKTILSYTQNIPKIELNVQMFEILLSTEIL